MNPLKNYKTIIFDFDGVILDSMPIRDWGFREIFKGHPEDKVEELVAYSNYQGGLSRFHKIRYFYENILEQPIEQEKADELAVQFSNLMRQEIPNPKYIIETTYDYIVNNKTQTFHVASGSEQTELRYICKKLGIDTYFKEIYGSPIHKNQLVKTIMEENKYNLDEVAMIGDSINDYEAAITNGITFYGFNNPKLKEVSENYLETFE